MSSRAGGGGSGVGERWYDSRPPFIFIFLFSLPSLFCSRCSGDEQHNKLEAGSRGTERKKKRKRELKKSHGRGKKKKREEKEAQDEDAAGRRWRKMVLGGVGGQDAGSGDGMKRTSDERGDPLAVAMDRRFEQRCFHEKEIGEDGGMKGRGRRSRRRGGGLADSTRRSFVMGRDGGKKRAACWDEEKEGENFSARGNCCPQGCCICTANFAWIRYCWGWLASIPASASPRYMSQLSLLVLRIKGKKQNKTGSGGSFRHRGIVNLLFHRLGGRPFLDTHTHTDREARASVCVSVSMGARFEGSCFSRNRVIERRNSPAYPSFSRCFTATILSNGKNFF